MPFSNYKNIAMVAKEFLIQYHREDFMKEITFSLPQLLQEDLEILLTDGIIDNSESAICENLIYPILKEIWKEYRQTLTLWSHETLIYDEKLSGQPDYIVAQRSPLGRFILDKPYFLTVEAKQDKFEEGWGQCLAEMVAVQKLNGDEKQRIFGIVSNGKVWQFGQLQGDRFTRNQFFYTIQDLPQLLDAVNSDSQSLIYIFIHIVNYCSPTYHFLGYCCINLRTSSA